MSGSDDAGSVQVALVQVASELEPERNRAALEHLVPDDADLVVLPEAFARDFGPAGSDISPFAETVEGPFAREVERLAEARGTTVLAGMVERSDDPTRPLNTLLLRGAASAEYRKIHLYDSFGHRESDQFRAGPLDPVTVPFGAFTLGLMTCYDLRFPELARGLVASGADVLVLPAAWVAGERKVDHWRTLLRARAVENTAYVVACGQPAPRYCGHSMVVSPEGDVLAEAGPGDATAGEFSAEVVRAVLEPDAVARTRRRNPSLANRRL